MSPVIGQRKFPVVDMADVIAGKAGAVERAGAEVRAACNDVAFFFVKNHGVPQTLIDDIIEQARRFHAQPMEEKMKIAVGPELLGYLLPGGQTQRTSIYNKNTRRELSASFYARREYPPDHPDYDKPWSHHNKWPENLPGFHDAAIAYYNALDDLFAEILPLFSVALGMEPDYFNNHPGFSPPNPNLRLLEYPSQDPNEENLFGIGPHSDYGCITILNQGPSPGLEVLMPSGDWVSAPMLKGHFLINTGQLLTRWSNDTIPATPHRVINSTGHLRHSVAFLTATRPDVLIECLPSCQGPGNPPKYPPVTYGEHIAAIHKQNYDIPDQKTEAAE